MKTVKITTINTILILLGMFLMAACETDSGTKPKQNILNSDKDALLFMLDEEKLARDTYDYLSNLWGFRIFDNIKNSEQMHMDEISSLLDQYNTPYNILEKGIFNNADLQEYYDGFVVDGKKSLIAALKIGATIEDLDIVDLEKYKNASKNSAVIASFNKLQCGSRNHLRSYVASINRSGSEYTPTFLSREAYDRIIKSNHERCNEK